MRDTEIFRIWGKKHLKKKKTIEKSAVSELVMI